MDCGQITCFTNILKVYNADTDYLSDEDVLPGFVLDLEGILS